MTGLSYLGGRPAKLYAEVGKVKRLQALVAVLLVLGAGSLWQVPIHDGSQAPILIQAGEAGAGGG